MSTIHRPHTDVHRPLPDGIAASISSRILRSPIYPPSTKLYTLAQPHADARRSARVVAELDEAFEGARREADGFVLTTEHLHEALPALFAHLDAGGHRLRRLSTHRATLEDVFVHLTGKRLRE